MKGAGVLSAAGVAAIAYGLARRTSWGSVLGVGAGVFLGAQAFAALTGKKGTGSVERSIRIKRTPKDVYDFVRNVESLPGLLPYTHDVREDPDGRIHWVIRLSNGLKLAYDGEMIDDVPGSLFTYRSAAEEPIDETGTLLFEAVGDGETEFTVRVAWSFPAGAAGDALAKVFEPITSDALDEALRRFKRHLEREGAGDR